MRLLIIDVAGAAVDYALRCAEDGHTVKVFMPNDKKLASVGKGLIDRIDDYRTYMRWADLVFVTDNTKYIVDLDKWRDVQPSILAPGVVAAGWEQNREEGQKALKKAGIATIPYRMFTDYDSAISYVKRENRRFVSKPSIDVDKALSYVAQSPADMVYMLERWKRAQKHKHPFMLQEYVAGIEMGVGGWFGPHGWNLGWEENFEFKKLMNDDMGMATGEQGTVLRVVRKSKLADKVLKPLTQELLRIGYVGNIDVNCIIDEAGVAWPLEFTTRPGWPAFNIIQELHRGDRAQWLLDLTKGIDARNWTLDTIAIGVVLSIPDYPYSHLTQKEVTGVPIYGAEQVWKHLHPCEMMMAEAPASVQGKLVNTLMPVTAGDYVLVMSETGETVQAARRHVYRALTKLIVPNSPMYRTDIGTRLRRQLPKLHAMGYATGMVFSETNNSTP